MTKLEELEDTNDPDTSEYWWPLYLLEAHKFLAAARANDLDYGMTSVALEVLRRVVKSGYKPEKDTMANTKKNHIKKLLDKASSSHNGQEAHEYAQAAYYTSRTLLNVGILND
jgi:hypothetical protein